MALPKKLYVAILLVLFKCSKMLRDKGVIRIDAEGRAALVQDGKDRGPENKGHERICAFSWGSLLAFTCAEVFQNLLLCSMLTAGGV